MYFEWIHVMHVSFSAITYSFLSNCGRKENNYAYSKILFYISLSRALIYTYYNYA